MAVVRARTSPPYALILFVVLWVISTGFAIFLFTKQGELKKSVEDLNADRQKLAKDSEVKTLADFQTNSKVKGDTGTGALKSQWEALLTAINKPGTTPADYRPASADNATMIAADKIRQAKDVIEGLRSADVKKTMQESKDNKTSDGKGGETYKFPGTLTESVQQLASALDLADRRIVDIEAALKAEKEGREADKVAAEADKAKVIAEKSTAEASNAKLNGELTAERGKVEMATKQGNEQVNKLTENYEKQLRDSQLQLAEIKALLSNAQKTIVHLTEQIRAGRSTLLKGIPDKASASIARTNVLAKEVVIPLGEADRVVRGLTFVVFDGRTGVKTDKGQETGKGSIEVIDVGVHESRCRITRVARNQQIEVGDLVYNLVFSQQKDRKFRFAVFGDFDLDGDGNSTGAERERLVSMITSWGGIVDEIPVVEFRDSNGQPILDAEGKPKKGPQVLPITDFLIEGTRPVDPKMTKDLDLVSQDQIDKLKADYSAFQQIDGSARASGVQILNTNRFLNLIGYYNTTLVRY